MSLDFSASVFFDLSTWTYRDLLIDSKFVWEALGDRLKAFCADFPRWEVLTELHPGVHLLGERISIGRGCRIEPGAVIVGPAILGDNAIRVYQLG